MKTTNRPRSVAHITLLTFFLVVFNSPLTFSAEANALTKKMISNIEEISRTIEIKKRTVKNYSAEEDSQLAQLADEVSSLLDQGADPNHYQPYQLRVMNGNDFSAFTASIMIAGALHRPQLVQSFLKHKATATHQAESGWTPMDSAIVVFYFAQFKSAAHVKDALAIVQSLENNGASLAQAKKTAATYYKTDQFRNYAQLAHQFLGIQVLHEEKVVSDQEFSESFAGALPEREKLKNAAAITTDDLKDLGAKIDQAEPYRVRDGESFNDIAQKFYTAMRISSVEEAAKEIAKENNLTGESPPAGSELTIPVMKSEELQSSNNKTEVMPTFQIYHNLSADSATESSTGGQSQTPVHLFVIEESSYHGHSANTFGSAINTAIALNPEVNLNQIHSWSEKLLLYPYSLQFSSALKVLLNLADSSLQSRVVFSHSMGLDIPDSQGNTFLNLSDQNSFDYVTIKGFQPHLEKNKPIIFQAAGNNHLSEGNFMASNGFVHSPRTVLIGAADIYASHENKTVVSPTSGNGADLCMTLPQGIHEIMHGTTSIATPVAAALYRQLAESYEDQLSFEEIMAAGLLSARTDFYEFQGSNKSLPPKPATIVKNHGGLAQHSQCGAGIIDEVQWKKTLDRMISLKEKPASAPTNFVSKMIPLKNDNGSYFIEVPQDLILGRLTFFLPQELKKHSDFQVVMPSGFPKKLFKSTTQVLSTSVFTFENVKAGDKIVIQTKSPIIEGAIMLRGYPKNSLVDRLLGQ